MAWKQHRFSFFSVVGLLLFFPLSPCRVGGIKSALLICHFNGCFSCTGEHGCCGGLGHLSEMGNGKVPTSLAQLLSVGAEAPKRARHCIHGLQQPPSF